VGAFSGQKEENEEANVCIQVEKESEDCCTSCNFSPFFLSLDESLREERKGEFWVSL
jgi:hypothetical protein